MAFAIPTVESLAEEAVTHLKSLVRIDTSNPPGNEIAAARYAAKVLSEAGLDPKVFESAPGRGNVVCRLKGTGGGSPLMLISHIDVVGADPAAWRRPPFGAEEADGCIWGRGTIDMKNMAAQSLCVMAALARAGFAGKRDLILSFTADEEEGGAMGAGWLVDNHPDLVRAEFALGEIGGFSLETKRRRVYPVMTAEKGRVLLRARARGDGGHGSMPVSENALSKLGIAAYRLGNAKLPARITKSAAALIGALAGESGAVQGAFMKAMLRPSLTDAIIDNLIREPAKKRTLNATLHNTVSPTVARVGEKFNVIPTEAEMVLDGRFLPGVSLEEFVGEVREAAGPTVEIIAEGYMQPLEASSDTDLFRIIAKAVDAADPGSVVTPYLVSGFTDWKHYSRLGTTVYGFSPLIRLPAGFEFAPLIHAADERVPVKPFIDGTAALMKVVTDYCG